MEANSSPMAVSTWINERVVLLVLKVSRIVVGTYLAEQDLIKAGLKAGEKVEEEETGKRGMLSQRETPPFPSPLILLLLPDAADSICDVPVTYQQ
ncbi:unnamed protein product [Brugia timori]|uniref:Ubiquitin-like domain-containing protein n=1 Tax=Brugia timori TaxID=42155 RepID=A0A0R3QJI6_9BILA|nr:unnamed protein product [Brugia timori]